MLAEKQELLHAVAARFIMGEDVEIEISGEKPQLDALRELLEVSRELKNQLDNEDKIENISETLDLKRKLTKRFQNLTGITWRL